MALLDAESLNAQMVSSNGFELFYSGDKEYFWEGVERVLGKPDKKMSLTEAMAAEHLEREDSHQWFDTPNYKIHTTSRIEWYFVVGKQWTSEPVSSPLLLSHPPLLLTHRPGSLSLFSDPIDGLKDKLNMGEWPLMYTPDKAKREPKPFAYFMDKWEDINKKLVAVGETQLNEDEFAALRLYTGILGIRIAASNAAPSALQLFESHARSFLASCRTDVCEVQFCASWHCERRYTTQEPLQDDLQRQLLSDDDPYPLCRHYQTF